MFSKNNQGICDDDTSKMAENLLKKLTSPNTIRLIKQKHARILRDTEYKTAICVDQDDVQIEDSLWCLRSCFPTFNQPDLTTSPINNDFGYYIDGYKEKRKFICCKNPNEETIGSFFQTVWDNKIKIIVTFCTSLFNGVYYRYWPIRINLEKRYDTFTVKALSITINSYSVLTILNLVNHNNSVRIVQHYCYNRWPQNESCYDAESILQLIDDINGVNRNIYPFLCIEKYIKQSPILVHCNDGMNKSAAFCLIDNSISMFKHVGDICIPCLFVKLLRQKNNCINEVSNYIFCHYVVFKFILKYN
uniref:Putative tyrosine phosphatase protein n=1 Tax=Toxoneuron nigriceps polydnavirus TaxID=191766 RepID=Q5W3L2_9VIRU|nr:putative tyrosine phosphatase protein [Toxoneuron nigriceps polydnavirus]